MFTVHFLEISIAFVLKLYSLNVIKKKNGELIESLWIENESNRDIWIDIQPRDVTITGLTIYHDKTPHG